MWFEYNKLYSLHIDFSYLLCFTLPRCFKMSYAENIPPPPPQLIGNPGERGGGRNSVKKGEDVYM